MNLLRATGHYNGVMTRWMTATQLKATILATLDEVAGGDDVAITKHGRPVARLVPMTGSSALRGKFAGVATTAAADEAELFSAGAAWSIE